MEAGRASAYRTGQIVDGLIALNALKENQTHCLTSAISKWCNLALNDFVIIVE
jgi:hypothetical protein